MKDKKPPKPPKANREQTSESIASIAGRLLNGYSVAAAEMWLNEIAFHDPTADDRDKTNALTLLGTLEGMRRLAGSALTQHGGK